MLVLFAVMVPVNWAVKGRIYHRRFLNQSPPGYDGKWRGLVAILAHKFERIFNDYNITNNHLWEQQAMLTLINDIGIWWRIVKRNYIDEGVT